MPLPLGGVDREEGGEPPHTAARSEGGDRHVPSELPRQPAVRLERGGHEFTRGAVRAARVTGQGQCLGPGPGGDLVLARTRYRVGVRHGCLLGGWLLSVQVLPWRREVRAVLEA
ncbi:hypothetical protein [Streptomyces sp. NPDC057363]|uniref:hypothetical protein n=1 Tax=unclassified Streptomyces TaxID=2593676 RepID=UPI0036314418